MALSKTGQVENGENLDVTLAWTSSPQASQYVVYWRKSTESYNGTDKSSGTSPATISVLNDESVYYFKVITYDNQDRASEVFE